MVGEITLAIGSIKSTLDIAKGILSASNTIAKADLKLQISELIDKLVDAQQQLREAKEKLAAQESVEYDPDGSVWWQVGKRGKGAPFCPKCKAADSKLVHLQSIEVGPTDTGSGYFIWNCIVCQSSIMIKDRPGKPQLAPRPRSGWINLQRS